jgi:hypothetical protein
MPVGIHAQGFMGLAHETSQGTYVAPTKFFPIRSETLTYQQDTQWRRVIRGLADNLGAIKGNSHVEGNIVMELMEDALPYFLHASHVSIAKSGTGPYTYVTTPTHTATGTVKPGMSITIVRAGVTFGYVGCVVSGVEFGVDNGTPIVTFSIIGMDETTQSTPSYAALTTSIPFGADQWNVQIPTASQVFDVSDFTCNINDNASAQYRLNNNTKAQFVTFGRREVTLKTTRDFNGRTEYDAFKALTTSSLTVAWSKGAGASVTIVLPNPVRETYDLDGLSDQGTLHMATVQWQGIYDATSSKSCQLTVVCNENIT